MYSPGTLNVAVVDAFPSVGSTIGLGFSNITGPGPRNLLQTIFAGGPWRGRASGGCFPSSLSHTVSGRGSATQRGFRCIGTDVVCPLAVMVHVSLLSPKSFGTIIVKTPHWRRGRKY